MPRSGTLNGSTHDSDRRWKSQLPPLHESGQRQTPNMANESEIKWLSDVEDHDYAAARSYLCLLCDESTAAKHVEHLRKAPVTKFMAKDIFRASGLSLLGVSNSHVQHDRE
jgi:hypothetical protein